MLPFWFSYFSIIIASYIIAGGCTKTEEEEGPSTEEDTQSFHGVGVCKWFNVRMGFGFLSMNSREGEQLEAPVDVFVHQVAHNVFYNFINSCTSQNVFFPGVCTVVQLVFILIGLMTGIMAKI